MVVVVVVKKGVEVWAVGTGRLWGRIRPSRVGRWVGGSVGVAAVLSVAEQQQ